MISNPTVPATSTITTTGTQTALAIPNGPGELVIFANNASLLTLQGITAGADGQRLTLYSIGAGQVDLVDQSASASAALRIINGVTGNISLGAGVGRVVLVYDLTATRWRVQQHEQGAWITPAYAAGDFTGSGSMTWTVAAGDVGTFAYYLRGRALTIALTLNSTTVGGTPAALLQIAIPGGLVSKKEMYTTANYLDNGTRGVGRLSVSASGTLLLFANATVVAWAASTDNTSMFGTITFEVQ